MTTELIEEIRERIVMGGGIGHVREDELEQWSRLRALYDQLLEQWTWRPIEEAPIPGPDVAPDGFVFNCLLQNSKGIRGEGIARYVTDNRVRGKKHIRLLRWYFGDGARDSRVCSDPRYFMPLPQPRKD